MTIIPVAVRRSGKSSSRKSHNFQREQQEQRRGGGIQEISRCEELEPRTLLTTVSLHLNNPIITEGAGAATFTFTRDSTAGGLIVDYRVGGSAPASQFSQPFSGQVTFANGQSTVNLVATTVDDHVADPDRTLTIAITQPEGTSYSVGTINQSTTLVVDADGGQATHRDLYVGPGQTYATVSAAVAASQDGDYIDVLSSGNYANDTVAISHNNVTIRGIGDGRALMNWTSTTTSLPNEKGIILFQTGASNLTVENMELDGAWVSSALGNNGAGIRAQGTNIVVTNCGMDHDQMGFLTGVGAVLVQYSEFGFNFNGVGDGIAHNIYINTTCTTFTFQYNYSHDANQGHLLKSRAQVNRILYNYFDDGTSASSYEISTPNGGQTTIIGNVVVQEVSSPNAAIIDYGSETNPFPPQPGDFLYVANNTVINYQSVGTFVQLLNLPANFDFTLENNIFAGAGSIYTMGGSTTTPRLNAGNYRSTTVAGAGFVNSAAGDYHILSTSGAVHAGVALGSDPNGFSLTPVDEYVSLEAYRSRAVRTPLDAGAFALIVPAPEITNVLVSGTAWKSPFLTYLASNGMGNGVGTSDGFSVVGANQLKTLPWSNINEIAVAFSGDVTGNGAGGAAGANMQNMLSLSGINVSSYAIIGFTYNATEHLGVWTLGSSPTDDKLTLSLSDAVTDLSGNALDGEWIDNQSAPSGNGTAGGVFTMHLNALAGDVDRNNAVLGNDVTKVYSIQGATAAGGGNYNPFYDSDGNGAILGVDVTRTQTFQGHTLPPGSYPLSAFSSAALITLDSSSSILFEPLRSILG